MAKRPSIARPSIAVIDDDDGVRVALTDLLRAADFGARAFGSAEVFLARVPADRFECLIVDINLPGMTGVALLNPPCSSPGDTIRERSTSSAARLRCPTSGNPSGTPSCSTPCAAPWPLAEYYTFVHHTLS
jgi:hypothetical protein